MTTAPATAQQTSPAAETTRHDWSVDQIVALLQQPLMELLWQAQEVH
ncbi:MAG: biotin synthase, partial [Cyanobacteria bacterium K_DeepCast_35m_m2_023]|nr:biotin synthase [Cyanobacteria bacterium K_DeepCast_35m_m2_023]